MASQIRARNTQFLQDLYAKQVDAENQLKLKLTSARQTQESFRVQDLNTGAQTVSALVGNRGTVKPIDFTGFVPGSNTKVGVGAIDATEEDPNAPLFAEET